METSPEPAFERTEFSDEPIVSSDEPVLLSAEQVDYDQERGIVTATGHVEIAQGDTILLADVLIYDQPNNQVKAYGHVSMLEPSGTVYFAEALVLKDDLKEGVIEQFRARLSDNSLMVASTAHKIDEQRLELFNAAYTPCKCGSEGPENPQWQVKAERVTVDQEAQKVRYEDATFETYGLPILYTPYLSHPTPDAENQSGLLTPEYLHSDNLGSVFKVPVYYSIASDKDVTLTPIYTSTEGLVMAGEYRQMFDAGPLLLDGSLTRPQDRDASGNPTHGNEFRGHIDAFGHFRVAENTNWGFDVHRATDDTYLRRYNFSDETLLTSKIYGETFNFADDFAESDRSYAAMQGLYFQGLTAQDNQNAIPVILPLTDVTLESDPMWYNSRLTFDGNAMLLTRDLGAESRRVSAITGWKLPYITEGGQVIEVATQLRSDVYSVSDVALSNGRVYDGVTGRLVPQASMLWRYPFMNRWEDGGVIIEPTVSLALSPGGGNPEKIPNEDSLVPEFTDTNLFSTNRFAGLDRIESGPRMSYGLRGQVQMLTNKYINWVVGQNYRTHNDPSFPFSNDLTSHFSDYVGRVGFIYHPFDLAYRFRLDKDSFAAQRNELIGAVDYDPLRFSVSYLSLKNDPILDNKENISGRMSLALTRYWTWTVGGAEDLEVGQVTSINTGFIYRNECTEFMSLVGREYIRDRDVEPSTNFLFRISLKNLQ